MKRSESSVRSHASGVVKTIVLIFAVAAAALRIAGPAGAETLRLTLEEAIALGIKNSSTVQSKGIAIASAKAATAATKAARYPSLSLTGTWSRLWEQPSPVTLFILLNTPPLGSEQTVLAHSFTLLSHVALIAFAGVAGNVCLYRLLVRLAGGRFAARRVLTAWLLANLFLGCQLSWNMRPFIGSPGLPIEFFRPDAFQGTFYESTFQAFKNLVTKKEKRHESKHPPHSRNSPTRAEDRSR